MNIQILGAMLKQGCYRRNFPYVLEIMNITQNERLKPNKPFLMHLHQFNHLCYKLQKSNHKYAKNEAFEVGFEKFKLKLRKWNQFMGLDKKLDDAVKTVEEHPWEQFQSVEATGIEDVKNPKLRKVKKVSRHIKRLTPNKLGVDEDSLLTTKNGN